MRRVRAMLVAAMILTVAAAEGQDRPAPETLLTLLSDPGRLAADPGKVVEALKAPFEVTAPDVSLSTVVGWLREAGVAVVVPRMMLQRRLKAVPYDRLDVNATKIPRWLMAETCLDALGFTHRAFPYGVVESKDHGYIGILVIIDMPMAEGYTVSTPGFDDDDEPDDAGGDPEPEAPASEAE